jgi:subtilase family serine protease
MVSALCPNCHILLVEANSSYLSDLGTGVNTAVNVFHANVVSNSYGSSEYGSETTDSANYYNHPGVAVVVSSGDSGYGVQFPAASQYVTAVGGTSLTQNTNTGTRNGTETAWSGAGSGCSSYEAKPAWQHDSGCANRTVADASAVADPNTGVWVYDTYGTGGTWGILGGTSVAAPLIGSVYALAGNPASANTLASYPYTNQSANPAVLNDVTSGSNGSCGGSYLCTAISGYDGPTGLGTPNGDAAFVATATATAPSAPRTLAAIGSATQVKLTWSAPASNGGSAVTSYNVYRGTAANGEGATPYASAITSTSYTDTAVTKGTTYFYKVTALNSVGEGLASNEASAKAASLPTAPLSLTAKTSSTRGVTLSWHAPSSDGGSTILSYRIYRSRTSGKETSYVTVTATCKAGTCTATYNDSNTSAGATYYYQVAAINAIGTGPRSNQASAKAR